MRNSEARDDRCGVVRVAGHFGELLQGRLGPCGPVVLATLPCDAVSMRAQFSPMPHAPLMAVGKGEVRKVAALAQRAASAALRSHNRRGFGGRLRLAGGAPPGAGCGVSTMSILGAIRAVRAALDASALPPEVEAALTLEIEGASDPLMFRAPGAMLWASREARPVQSLRWTPSFEVLGVFDGPGRPTDPADQNFANIEDLVAPFADAVAAKKLEEIGALATESARRNGVGKRLSRYDAVTSLAFQTGACGVAAAHTGSALALLYRPGADGVVAARAGLQRLGWPKPLRFLSNEARRSRS